MAEAWLPVYGFEGFYEVSNLGRVRSVNRTVTRDYGDGRKTTVRRRGAIMKFDYRDGYATVTTFARSVLDDANGAAMFAIMGAGQLLAENGWVKLPNGLIIQWGQGSAGSGTATIAFPMAFPNACYGVTLGTEISNTTAAELYTTHVSSKTLTNFVLNGRFVVGGSVGAGGVPANYIAIGR